MIWNSVSLAEYSDHAIRFGVYHSHPSLTSHALSDLEPAVASSFVMCIAFSDLPSLFDHVQHEG